MRVADPRDLMTDVELTELADEVAARLGAVVAALSTGSEEEVTAPATLSGSRVPGS